jgi:hypothetical protein
LIFCTIIGVAQAFEWTCSSRGEVTLIFTKKYIWLAGLILVVIMSACGGDDDTGPGLSAPPTRTPLPPTLTPDVTPGGPTLDNIQIISLRSQLDNFLTEAEASSPLDRPELFQQHVINAAPDCMTPTFFPDTLPLEVLGANINLIEADLARWRVATDTFPEQALIDQTREMLWQIVDLLPTDRPLRICLMPVPADAPPEDLLGGGIDAQVLASDLIVVTCAGGEYCLDGIGRTIAFSYHYAYQIAQTGLTYPFTPVLHFALYNARAADFTRHFYPDLVYPWTNALTPEQERALWGEMRDYLGTTYQDYPDYRRIPKLLYGNADPNQRYPQWGGMFIGEQIIRAYHAVHPSTTYEKLAQMTPEAILTASRYAPG